MRRLVIGIGVLALAATGHGRAADRAPEPACLSSGATMEAVSSSDVVAPRAAIGAAVRMVPDGEVLRAALCPGGGEALVYVVVLLQKDGRLARVAVDARSGTAARID